MVAVALAAAAPASAARILGDARANVLHGTAAPDTILARGGDDGVVAQGGHIDTIWCGRGRDVVSVDGFDRAARDCEVVDRQISSDPFANAESQHEADVEPDSFAWGSTVVAVFQVGRIATGGAANIGFAVSHDAGRTWRSGQLPALTRLATPSGPWARASDPVVAYDSVHRVWLAASLALSSDRTGIVVSRSTDDGNSWSAPVAVRDLSARNGLPLDKEWIACDNVPTSRFRGRCYVSYSDIGPRRLSTQFSADGGLTWSAPVGSPDDAGRAGIVGQGAPAPQPMFTRDGTVVIPIFENNRIAVVRSTDGGATFSPETTIAPVDWRSAPFRAAPLPSGESDSGGGLYLAWSDSSSVWLTRSTDGVTWTAPERAPFGPDRHLMPGLGARWDAPGQLALSAYRYTGLGRLSVVLVRSQNGGRTWSKPQRLSPEPMRLEWLARSEGGRMLGDYVSTSFAGARVVPVFTLAASPTGSRLREAIFAPSLP